MTTPRSSRGKTARRSCRRAVLLLALLACLVGCETLYYLAVPEHDPDTRSADFSHFRDTLLDNLIRADWEARRWMVDCIGGGIHTYIEPGLRKHYGREAPDRVTADLQAQGATCVPTDTDAYMCVYRQVAHCKTRGLLVRSADYRGDIELRVELRDDPDDNKRIVITSSSKSTKLEPRD